jgi:hypothetical protein
MAEVFYLYAGTVRSAAGAMQANRSSGWVGSTSRRITRHGNVMCTRSGSLGSGNFFQ